MEDNLPESSRRLTPAMWVLIMVAIAAAVLWGAYFYLLRTGKLTNLLRKPTPTPATFKWSPYTTTPPPIGHGIQQYTVSGGVKGLPTIEWIKFDPVDPATGATQTITVKANDANPIKAVYVVLHTDNDKTTQYTLLPRAGTLTNGEWKATFSAVNPYNFNYRATIKVQNQNNLFQMMTVTLR